MERVLFTIPTPGVVRDIVTRPDLGAAYVATDAGIMVIDTFAVQQFDADPTTPEKDMIYTGRALVVHGGVVYRDNPVTALALDPAARDLSAATLGKIPVIDLAPNSPAYLQIISNEPTRTIHESIPAANGGTPYA